MVQSPVVSAMERGEWWLRTGATRRHQPGHHFGGQPPGAHCRIVSVEPPRLFGVDAHHGKAAQPLVVLAVERPRIDQIALGMQVGLAK
jgi:hypothetical protein